MRLYSNQTKHALVLLVARTVWTGTPLLQSSALVIHQNHYNRAAPPRATAPPVGVSSRPFRSAQVALFAKPKKAGSTVDSYQTVSVNCGSCRERLFRYKKKNGTKSNLVKCYVERVSEDCAGILAGAAEAAAKGASSGSGHDGDGNGHREAGSRRKNPSGRRAGGKPKPPGSAKPAAEPEPDGAVPVLQSLDPGYSWECPSCGTKFARSSVIHGRPALKLIGGKTRMTKK